MPTLQLYDKLLQFPLFQGLSRSDLMQIAAHTKLDFRKFAAGKRVVREGKPCDRLYFLINGTMTAETSADDYSYTFTEELSAPHIIQPESLFGLSQRYRCTYHALTDISVISIDKKEIVNLSDNLIVFRLNILNIYATQTQRMMRLPWARCPRTLRGRIVRFFLIHSQHPAGRKTIHIIMKRLASEMNDSRIDVSRALNEMQADGLIELSRGRIVIPSLERLLSFPMENT